MNRQDENFQILGIIEENICNGFLNIMMLIRSEEYWNIIPKEVLNISELQFKETQKSGEDDMSE